MPFKIISSYDGCPGKELTHSIPTYFIALEVLRVLHKDYKNILEADPKFSLDILNTETGRLVSYVL